MYKLFTDKTELFECNISLQGASLKKSKARLVVETQDYSLLFMVLLILMVNAKYQSENSRVL